MIRVISASKSEKGALLITGLMVMLIISMLGIAYLMLTNSNLIRANRDERRTTALYLAEAGIEYVISDIMEEASANGGVITAKTYDSEIDSVFYDLKPGAAGNVVVETDSSTSAVLTSNATYRGITEGIRVRLTIKNIGIWDNAIFAGMGQAGLGINGNVNIRGSVHILGEGEPFSDLNGNGVWDDAEPFDDVSGTGDFRPDLGDTFTDLDGNGVWTPAEPYIDLNGNGVYDPPLTATELATDISGSASIGNNYSGMPIALRNKIPALVPQSFNDEMVETLNAELRVKHGKVNISGSATVGQPFVSGNGIKETMDGVYVTHGFGGNQGEDSVHSDNGTGQGYDLGDRISFPYLFEPFTDPSTGINYTSYENYLDNNSLDVNINKIDSTVSSFSLSDGVNSIDWNQSTETLTLSGIIRISGDFDLSSKGKTVNYAGSGTLLVKGNANVRGNVMPVNTFPAADALGCIVTEDINFATGGGEAQLMAAGAWYAQGAIRSGKQSEFAGTYVASFFDMGNQVPNIYQVPALSQYLPPGMPGGESVISVRVTSWRHL